LVHATMRIGSVRLIGPISGYGPSFNISTSTYAGRVGSGINTAELERLWRRLQPFATDKMPLDLPPPRSTCFGPPLVLSRVHWVRPELVAEVKFLTWTQDNLLRQVVYQGLRGDKPATEVQRTAPRPGGR
jgi:ATP-dependent DNA ligase